MNISPKLKVYGNHDQKTLDQMNMALASESAIRGVLCADGHVGYSVPIGGVVAYYDKVSPAAVGYDIACGIKAVRTDFSAGELHRSIEGIMDEVFRIISFGVGRKNNEPVDSPIFNDSAWDVDVARSLKSLAEQQLGTVGSGNHFVDILTDEEDRVWIMCHFGSRGFGHKIATHFIKAGGGKDGMFVEPVLLDVNTQLGQEYIACMRLAGKYAYAGRDWVCQRVADMLGTRIQEEVHNHHNFAWKETHFGEDVWVVRKGATPAAPGQMGAIGGSMGDNAVIVKGIDGPESKESLYSTVHGAGRVMSRTQAAGKSKFVSGRKVRVSEGEISRPMMMAWLQEKGVTLRGAGTDESPHAYKRLDDVLKYHASTMKVLHTLAPVGVAMASDGEEDPFRD